VLPLTRQQAASQKPPEQLLEEDQVGEANMEDEEAKEEGLRVPGEDTIVRSKRASSKATPR
jgi:hypothetical protein